MVAAVVVVCLLAVAGLAFEYGRFLSRRGPNTQPVAVSLSSELTPRKLAELLVSLGVSEHPNWLCLHLALSRADRCIVAGPHLLAPATPRELAAMVCRTSARPTAKVTFPEGAHRFAMATTLAAAGIVSRDAFLGATSDRALLRSLGIAAPTIDEPELREAIDTAEGFLFPATYTLHKDSEPADLIRTFAREAERRWKQATATNARGLAALEAMGMTRRTILTLASMVEKEAAVADERPTIASVFLNRLRDPLFKRLQSDPTAMYGCVAIPERIAACRSWNGKASPELNRDPANAYSTYVVDGLPPGPVANPGAAAIAAVLAPEATTYRYFVAKGGGRHAFSVTYPEHLEAVKALRERRQ